MKINHKEAFMLEQSLYREKMIVLGGKNLDGECINRIKKLCQLIKLLPILPMPDFTSEYSY